ncbi:cytochrome c3 family protein [Shewanella youngdeokensis]|uniref:Cytochrome c3 family protein n=1 Tax=Shewanella youngdeokensis TaxID=2999068 RepID=A0ABZ0K1Z8_9GAMM|nr:cytochrome c3 family protein [Shewanella sp. DAU334]
MKTVSLSCLLLAVAATAPLAHAKKELHGAHKEMKVKCKSCHVNGMKKPASMEGCFDCHGSYDDIRALSEEKELEANPHDSHLGDVECSDCHNIHKESAETVCAECHEFDFVTP